MSAGNPPTASAASGASWETLARAAGRRAPGEAVEAELQRELLAVELCDTPYALPVERVREIVRMRLVTPVPRLPRPVLGVIALRGEIVQVVDLRICLGLEPRPRTRRTRIVVLHGWLAPGDEGGREDDRVTGVLVDAVQEVLRVGPGDLRPATGAEADTVSELCVRGEEFVSILDLDRTLSFDGDR